jgi:hypothetical protein
LRQHSHHEHETGDLDRSDLGYAATILPINRANRSYRISSEQRDVLEGTGDPEAGDFVWGKMGDVLVLDQDATAIGMNAPADPIAQRGLCPLHVGR